MRVANRTSRRPEHKGCRTAQGALSAAGRRCRKVAGVPLPRTPVPLVSSPHVKNTTGIPAPNKCRNSGPPQPIRTGRTASAAACTPADFPLNHLADSWLLCPELFSRQRGYTSEPTSNVYFSRSTSSVTCNPPFTYMVRSPFETAGGGDANSICLSNLGRNLSSNDVLGSDVGGTAAGLSPSGVRLRSGVVADQSLMELMMMMEVRRKLVAYRWKESAKCFVFRSSMRPTVSCAVRGVIKARIFDPCDHRVINIDD